MLGRLARWLRVLGYDAAYGEGHLADRELVRWSLAEGRQLLTRDRGIPRELPACPCFIVRSEAPLEQLRDVVAHFGLAMPAELFTRCLVCNVPLEEVTDAALEEGAAAPPPAARDGGPLRRCPSCRRLYWEGTHTRRMRAALAGALHA